MYDLENLLDNIDQIYNSQSAFHILKDFERVLDEYFDIYVFDNWAEGELLKGPITNKYWVCCYFMWSDKKRPDPEALERMRSNGLLIKTGTNYFITPKKIRKQEDIRPGTKKGKLKREKVYVVGIKMPKKLMKTVYGGQDMFKVKETEDAMAQASEPMPEPSVDPSLDMSSDMGGMSSDMGADAGVPDVPGATV